MPIRSFATGFERLRPSISDSDRRSIARELARRVIAAAQSAGDVLVVSDSREVAEFAAGAGAEALAEPAPGGLNAAASAGIAAAGKWAVIHADLPLVTPRDLHEVVDLLDGGVSLLAPTHDGGTSLIGSHRPIDFAYGPGSFRRHLARLPESKVLIRRAFLMDVDTADDVRRLLA